MSSKTRPLGWWYPWIFVGMFLVVGGVNATLAYFASSTFNGLQTEQAYEKGLNYNQALAGAAAQERLGWVLRAELQPADGAGAGVAVEVTDKAGRPVEGLEVLAVFTRPTQAGHDRNVTLSEAGSGRYVGKVQLPLPGQWRMQVVANRGSDSYQSNQRVMLP